MTGTTRPAIRPITKSKPLARDEQNAGIDDGRHYETPKISPSAITSAERPSVSSGDPLRQSMCDNMDEQPRSSEHDQQDFLGHSFFTSAH